MIWKIMKILYNGHGILISSLTKAKEIRTLIYIVAKLKHTKLIKPLPCYKDIKKLIESSMEESVILHFDVDVKTDLSFLEMLRDYIFKSDKEVINRMDEGVRIIVTVNGIDSYERLKEVYPKLIDSMYVVFIPDDNLPVTIPDDLTNSIIPINILNEAYKVITTEIKGINKVKIYNYVKVASEFYKLLVRIYQNKGDYLSKLEVSLRIFKNWLYSAYEEQKVWEKQYKEGEKELEQVRNQLEEYIKELNESAILMKEKRNMCILHDNEFYKTKALIDSTLCEYDELFVKRLNMLKFLNPTQYIHNLTLINHENRNSIFNILKLLNFNAKESILNDKIEVEKLLESVIKLDVEEKVMMKFEEFMKVSDSNELITILKEIFGVVLDKRNKKMQCDYKKLSRLQKLTSDDQMTLISLKQVIT